MQYLRSFNESNNYDDIIDKAKAAFTAMYEFLNYTNELYIENNETWPMVPNKFGPEDFHLDIVNIIGSINTMLNLREDDIDILIINHDLCTPEEVQKKLLTYGNIVDGKWEPIDNFKQNVESLLTDNPKRIKKVIKHLDIILQIAESPRHEDISDVKDIIQVDVIEETNIPAEIHKERKSYRMPTFRGKSKNDFFTHNNNYKMKPIHVLTIQYNGRPSEVDKEKDEVTRKLRGDLRETFKSMNMEVTMTSIRTNDWNETDICIYEIY